MEIGKKFYRNECDGDLTTNGVYAYARVNFLDDDFVAMLVSEYDMRVSDLKMRSRLMKIYMQTLDYILDNVAGYSYSAHETHITETGSAIVNLKSLIFYDALTLAAYMQGKGAEISY